jgi:hypothetical protein
LKKSLLILERGSRMNTSNSTTDPSVLLIEGLEVFCRDFYNFVSEHPLSIEDPGEGLGLVGELLDEVHESASKLAPIDPEAVAICHTMFKIQKLLFECLLEEREKSTENFQACMHNAAHVLDCLRHCQAAGITHTTIARDAVGALANEYSFVQKTLGVSREDGRLLADAYQAAQTDLAKIHEAVKRCPSLTKPTLAENVEYACAMAQRGQDIHASRPSLLKRVVSFFTRR